MKNAYSTLVFVAKFAILGLAIAFLAGVFAPQWSGRVRSMFGAQPVVVADSGEHAAAVAEHVVTEHASAERESGTPIFSPEREHSGEGITVSYAGAVARAAPAVVNIYANRLVTARNVLVPTDPVLRRMVGVIAEGPTYKRGQQSLGSGVIVSADGYVLTNNHVIQGAEEIQAVLKDGRSAKATVVGSDPETDLAVLKLDVANLPTMAITASPPNVGDVVLAIGNPFGLGNTVTMGIVSALGRQLHKSTYEDFIQTDAAINQGNSGGALVNAYGELVGINSDVWSPSPSGGNIGIGFAIPVATAKTVLDQIVTHGKVIRGWMGAAYLDSAAVRNSGETVMPQGVTVVGVNPGGPAAIAGLQRGDVLLQLNGEPINGQFELLNREASLAPGTKIALSGTRNGAPLKAELTLQEKPQAPPSD